MVSILTLRDEMDSLLRLRDMRDLVGCALDELQLKLALLGITEKHYKIIHLDSDPRGWRDIRRPIVIYMKAGDVVRVADQHKATSQSN